MSLKTLVVRVTLLSFGVGSNWSIVTWLGLSILPGTSGPTMKETLMLAPAARLPSERLSSSSRRRNPHAAGRRDKIQVKGQPIAYLDTCGTPEPSLVTVRLNVTGAL